MGSGRGGGAGAGDGGDGAAASDTPFGELESAARSEAPDEGASTSSRRSGRDGF